MEAIHLVICQESNSHLLLLHTVRTSIRHEYSYITSAVVQIGDDTLEVASFGEYYLNGVGIDAEETDQTTVGGYPIVHEREVRHRAKSVFSDKFDVVVGPAENVSMSVFKDLVSVSIVGATEEQFGNSVGLLGDFEEGKLLARDGQTVIEDENAFGQEWQVSEDEPMLFQIARSPQQPYEGCRLPSKDVMDGRRRLGENQAKKEAAEKVCSHLTDGEMKKACVYDVIATGNLDVANIY